MHETILKKPHNTIRNYLRIKPYTLRPLNTLRKNLAVGFRTSWNNDSDHDDCCDRIFVFSPYIPKVCPTKPFTNHQMLNPYGGWYRGLMKQNTASGMRFHNITPYLHTYVHTYVHTLHYSTVHYNTLHALQHITTHCDTLQQVTILVHCNTLQY